VSRQVSGFPCPNCGQDELATIVSEDVVRILELRCECNDDVVTTWAVEL